MATNKRNSRNRDPEQLEDSEMAKNPRDFPFPTFNPAGDAGLRRKRDATAAIKDMEHGQGPVALVQKPVLSFAKPPWHYGQHIGHAYIPELDMLDVRDHRTARQVATQDQLEHPQWLNLVPRIASGCPQLGIPVAVEGQFPRTARAHKAENKKMAVETQRVAYLQRAAALSARGQSVSKQDQVLELLRDKKVLNTILKTTMSGQQAEGPRNVLVSLPKIGVRMFSVAPGSELAIAAAAAAESNAKKTASPKAKKSRGSFSGRGSQATFADM
jgi:hypothetical protein